MSEFAALRRGSLSKEEVAGLVVAVAAHVALVAWLTLKPPVVAPFPVPERMTVTFSEEVASKSTSPEPQAEAAPAIAPVLSANPVPEPAPELRPPPQALPAPAAQPVARVAPPPPRAAVQPAKPQPPAKAAPAKAPAKPAGGGGSRIGADFLKGIAGGQTPGAKAVTPPAAEIGPAVRSALSGAIARQLKPKWAAPQGAEADQLVTVLAFDLNPDGTLAGAPRVVSQSGITDANRPQAQRHAEQAVRAVRLAAPFDLPADLYAAWRHVTSFRFDRKLSQ